MGGMGGASKTNKKVGRGRASGLRGAMGRRHKPRMMFALAVLAGVCLIVARWRRPRRRSPPKSISPLTSSAPPPTSRPTRCSRCTGARCRLPSDTSWRTAPRPQGECGRRRYLSEGTLEMKGPERLSRGLSHRVRWRYRPGRNRERIHQGALYLGLLPCAQGKRTPCVPDLRAGSQPRFRGTGALAKEVNGAKPYGIGVEFTVPPIPPFPGRLTRRLKRITSRSAARKSPTTTRLRQAEARARQGTDRPEDVPEGRLPVQGR